MTWMFWIMFATSIVIEIANNRIIRKWQTICSDWEKTAREANVRGLRYLGENLSLRVEVEHLDRNYKTREALGAAKVQELSSIARASTALTDKALAENIKLINENARLRVELGYVQAQLGKASTS